MKQKLLFLLLYCSLAGIAQQNPDAGLKKADKGFIKNYGQVVDQNGVSNDRVRYLLNTRGLNVQLRSTGFSYDVYERKTLPASFNWLKHTEKLFKPKNRFEHHDSIQTSLSFHRVDIDFLNTSTDLKIEEYERGSAYYNYYNVPNCQEGITHVPFYQRIVYKNLYKGIDLEFIIPEDQGKPVEYNFKVQPGSNLADIKMRVAGAPVVLKNNRLELSLAQGILQETIPKSWIQENKAEEEVQVNYTQLAANTFGFEVAHPFNYKKPLIIDPTPVREWGTYFGGDYIDGSDFAEMSHDENGNTVYAGNTTSDNMATSGSHQTFHFWPTIGSVWNTGLMMKFDKDGDLKWCTYYGGMLVSYFHSIKYDNKNNIIAVGETYSDTNITTINAHQEFKEGNGADGFIVKLNNAGVRLWATYYGGVQNDRIFAVTVDNDNNIYATGVTNSQENIASPDTFKPTISKTAYGNSTDAFIVKFNPDGNRIWGTYYGGNSLDIFHNIEISSDQNLYLVGYSNSSEGIATSGTFKNTLSESPYDDAILVKFTLNGERLWGTYFGDKYDDHAFDVAIDNLGDVVISGGTGNLTGIAFNALHQSTMVGDYDNFLAKFNNSGNLIWSTYYGGDERETNVNCSVAIDSYNNIYLASRTSSKNNISTPGSYQETGDDFVAYFAKLDQFGNRLWGTYYGDFGSYASDIDVFDDIIYVFGSADYSTSMASENAYQTQALGADYFIGKFSNCKSEITVNGTSNLCPGEDIILTASGGTSYRWSGPDGFVSTLQNPVITEATQEQSGTYLVFVTNDTGCEDSRSFQVNVTPPPMANNLPDLVGCDDNNDGISEYFDTSQIETLVLNGQTGMQVSYYDASGNPLASPLPNPYTNTNPNTETLTLRVSNIQSGCYAETSLNLITSAQPQINQPATRFACDAGNGYSSFDLTNLEQEVTGSQAGLTVTYTDETGAELTRPLTAAFQNTTAWSQRITIRVENATNALCFSETYLDLEVNPLPQVSIDNTFVICDSEPGLQLSRPETFDSWEWEDPTGTIISTTAEVYLTQEGSYRLTIGEIQNGIMCTNTYAFALERSAPPTITKVDFSDWSDNNFIEVTATGDGEFEYSLDGSNWQDSNRFDFIKGGVYEARVRDKAGCGFASEEVILVDYMKVFTPNGDGFNDYWQIEGVAGFPEAKIYIFDRYGKLLKELSPQETGWDGSFADRNLPADDYWFHVDLGDGRVYKNHFTLKR
ncbi:DUF7948 domain-containing protein [Leeuwenhoekiella sp. H156]|uniref:DUF7948 domain-containing protein n=1 Tax=Leeuwenhoekiella sp. H156 TaxID=3450128 RepID=UPI003FA45068